MIRFSDYFQTVFHYTMYALDYKKIEPTDESREFNLLVNDTFSLERTDKNLVVYYVRKMRFQPEGVFVLNLTYKLVFDPVKDMGWSALSDQEILDALYDDTPDSLSEVSSRMSLVIGEVLFNGNHEPLILPPQVLRAPKEEPTK